MSPRIGVLALARPTFDVPFAEEVAAKAFAALDAAGVKTVGPRALHVRRGGGKGGTRRVEDAGRRSPVAAAGDLHRCDHDGRTRQTAKAPLAIWAFPEPRAGGRLRLNSFCGLNLALHALGRAGKSASYLYSRARCARHRGSSSRI